MTDVMHPDSLYAGCLATVLHLMIQETLGIGEQAVIRLQLITLLHIGAQTVTQALRDGDYPVTLLYMALEDNYRRLQERLYRLFGRDSTENLHFAICAKQLGSGLDEQLQKFVREHPDTKLIIIDTLQKIRETGGEKFSYANDYEIVG